MTGRKNRKINRTAMRIGLILILILPFALCLIIDFFRLPDISDYDRIELVIPRGSTPDGIADSLLRKGLIDNKKTFIFWLTSLDKDRDLKAGFYDIPVGLNYPQLIAYLTTARSKEIRLTLIEGWTTEQIADELSGVLNCDRDRLIQLSRDTTFIRELGLEVDNLEGYLLPDTYYFYWGMDEEALVRFLVTRTTSIFTDPVLARLDTMKMTQHEILILASIIEGEALFNSERDTIASVYHNRLKRRIKLQADPTIQYILDGPPRRLLYRDLEIDSPYNTYKYYGLPPGPINNPGYRSIMAAIYPADTNYLYFVARGDGRHTFSRTAREHAQAKAEFDKIRREVYRKRRLQ